MGLDDLFKHRNRYSHDHDHHDSRHYPQDENYDERHGRYKGHHYKYERFLAIIQNLPHKKTILIIVGVAVLLLLLLAVAFVWALFPFIVEAVNYVNKNGIQGVLETVLAFVEKIWKGGGAGN